MAYAYSNNIPNFLVAVLTRESYDSPILSAVSCTVDRTFLNRSGCSSSHSGGTRFHSGMFVGGEVLLGRYPQTRSQGFRSGIKIHESHPITFFQMIQQNHDGE